MKLIDLLLEQPSEKEKQRFLKKSLLIYGIYRKRNYNNYGIKISWVLSDDVEIEYKYLKESSAVIHPKDIHITLHNDIAIREWEVGNIQKKDFILILSNFLGPFNIRISISDDDIHVKIDKEEEPINENIQSNDRERLIKKAEMLYKKAFKRKRYTDKDGYDFSWELSDEALMGIHPNNKRWVYIEPVYIKVIMNNRKSDNLSKREIMDNIGLSFSQFNITLRDPESLIRKQSWYKPEDNN